MVPHKRKLPPCPDVLAARLRVYIRLFFIFYGFYMLRGCKPKSDACITEECRARDVGSKEWGGHAFSGPLTSKTGQYVSKKGNYTYEFVKSVGGMWPLRSPRFLRSYAELKLRRTSSLFSPNSSIYIQSC